MTVVSINGEIHNGAEASISVFDHGFLYGDSVYETIRTFRREPFLLNEHINRLRNSCDSIGIKITLNDDSFFNEIKKLQNYIDTEEYYYRIIITRGNGEFGYRINPEQKPNIIIFCKEFKGFSREWYETGITLYTVKRRRNHINCLDPSIKSSNLLNLRLAYNEAEKLGGQEAILLNLDGNIAECSSSSIFFIKERELLTPSLESGILPGITREFILRIADNLNIPYHENFIPESIIYACDECFITSTIKSVLPVSKIDERMFEDTPGVLTKTIMEAFNKATLGQMPLIA